MQALLSIMPGGPETLEIGELPDPVASTGEVLVRIRACSLNYPDALMIEDKYQFKPERPYAPGCEVAGVIETVGSGVTGFTVGDRVCAMIGHGGLAEQVAVPAEKLFHLPAERSFEEGAAFLMTYLTSIHALLDRGHIKAGDTLLVLGAAGGVGLAAVELGKALGARVVAAVSSVEKAALARAKGADETVVYPIAPLDKDQSKALAEAFKKACGPDGAHVIYDGVGGDYSEPALRAIAWEGRFLVVGFPAGIARLPLNLPLLKGCDICGVFLGAWREINPQANARHVAQLFALWNDGKIAPHISQRYTLQTAAQGISLLGARGALGKLVVSI